MVGGLVGYEEFIEWDPPHTMAFRFNEVSSSRGYGVRASTTPVHDLGDGRSLVEWRMAMTPDGPGAKVFPLPPHSWVQR